MHRSIGISGAAVLALLLGSSLATNAQTAPKDSGQGAGSPRSLIQPRSSRHAARGHVTVPHHRGHIRHPFNPATPIHGTFAGPRI